MLGQARTRMPSTVGNCATQIIKFGRLMAEMFRPELESLNLATPKSSTLQDCSLVRGQTTNTPYG